MAAAKEFTWSWHATKTSCMDVRRRFVPAWLGTVEARTILSIQPLSGMSVDGRRCGRNAFCAS
eukprot:5409698-Lingulodinium_polyedra.AAC.1